MAKRPPFHRRSFLARILGTTALGGAAGIITGGASARQVTDSDPTDPAGRGRGGSTGITDRDPTDPIGRGRGTSGQGQTGITDSDPTDPVGGGRGTAGGHGDQTGGRTGITDSDPTDRVGYGRGTQGGGQYTGVTDSDAGAGADRGGYGRGTGGGQQTGQLRAFLEYPRSPFVITNQELPSQLVNIVISGWDRNTSTPVQVVLPNSLDMSGNHPNALPFNGIQVQGAGSSTTYTWDEPFRWSLLVFSCPGQSGTGASCYGARATVVPGSFRIPIIVQQGNQVVNLTLMGTIVAHPPVRRR
ncbi:hypothetical protein [Brevundimonas sp.]|uniref:hypothetical protein n=1 Tax=Brevundimonas sp. TaxID=1871086 RepID=UPI0025D820F1|nr:hypothetical protein [Brevundimonas sp.]